MRPFIDFIGSRRFAIWLLLATTAVILLSNLLPKPYVMSDTELQALKRESPVLYQLSMKYNVGKVAKSPVFIGISVFLFVSITICTTRRVRIWAEEKERKAVLPDAGRLQVSSTVTIKGAVSTDQVGKVLVKKRWSLVEGDSGAARMLYARKGDMGFWGSAVFHAGMCIVLAGALVSAVSRYNGRLALTEDFGIDPVKELKGLSENQKYIFPVRGMMLNSFSPIYEGVFPVDYTAEISGIDQYGREFSSVVRVNEPLNSGVYTFLLTRYGFAPRFILKDSLGKVVSDDVVNLAVITPDKKDSFKLLNGRVTARVSFFPDFFIDSNEGRPVSRSRAPNNPVFLITVERPGRASEGGFLPLGGSLTFDEYTLEFKDLRYWAQFDVTKDSGVPVITLGFFLIVGGLLLRLILNEKAVWIIIHESEAGTRLDIGGRARFFPALFEEELRRVTEELNSAVETKRG